MAATGFPVLAYDPQPQKRKYRKFSVNWFNSAFAGGSDSTSPAWDEDALLIDVRTPAEYASGHVEGALNLPLERFVQEYAGIAPDKTRQIVLYCRSGARSGQAMQFLQQLNYQRAINGGSVGTVAIKTNRAVRRY